MLATTIEEALAAYLAANADLVALVGARINPDVSSQGASGLSLVFEFQSGDEMPYLSGEVNDLHKDTFQLTAIGDKRKEAAQVRDVLMAMFGGTVARGAWQPGIYVSGCTIRTAATSQPAADGSERQDRETSVLLTILWGRR